MHYACQIIANRLSYEYSLRDRHCYLSDQNECNHEHGDRAKNVLHVLMETENVLDAEPGASGVSQHLGHSTSTRDEYYVQEDERHHIQAAFRLWSKLQAIGKMKDHPVSQKKFEFEY